MSEYITREQDKITRNVGKHTFRYVRPAMIQISLRIRAVWSESSLSAWRNFASLAIQNASSEDSDQTARMRLMWKRWLSYKGTCHVILLKLHDMYLYKTDNFFHINHYLKSVSKVALLHRFYCK